MNKHPLDGVVNAIQLIRKETKRTTKIQILNSISSNSLIKELLQYCLNPHITYGINPWKVTPKYENTLSADESLILFRDLQKRLASRELSGNAATFELEKLLNSVSKEYGELFQYILSKDLEAGLQTSTVNKVWKNLIPNFDVMLCSKYEGEPLNSDLLWWIEPKLDGMRVLLFLEEGNMRALSRNGKPVYNLNPLLLSLFKIAPNNVIDCELYNGSWEESISAGKSFDSDEKPKIWAFDIIPIEEFNSGEGVSPLYKRRNTLENIYEKWINTTDLSLQNQFNLNKKIVVNEPVEVYEATEIFMEEGFEGAVLKNSNSVYEFKRSKNWMKITRELLPNSQQYNEDYLIIGVQEGRGRLEGLLGAFICETSNGKEFHCGSGLSDIQRKEFWSKSESLAGNYIEVKFRRMTPDGVPLFPIFKRLREDK